MPRAVAMARSVLVLATFVALQAAGTLGQSAGPTLSTSLASESATQTLPQAPDPALQSCQSSLSSLESSYMWGIIFNTIGHSLLISTIILLNVTICIQRRTISNVIAGAGVTSHRV
jgi:hypothetical protein